MDVLWVVYDALAHHQLPAFGGRLVDTVRRKPTNCVSYSRIFFRKGRFAHQQKLELEIAEGCAEGRHQTL